MSAITPAARKLAGELSGRATGSRPTSWLEPAEVTAVTAGAAVDGNALVTVLWRGIEVPAAYAASYLPAPGDVVLLNVQPPSVVILCRVIGRPPATI